MDTQHTDSSASNNVAGMSIEGIQRPMLYCMPKSSVWRFYFYGPVTAPADYIELINALDSAGDNDEIHLFINTMGGRLDTTISIVHAIERTLGTVICHADGDVISAGSIIFFSGHQWVIYPHSTFMLHDGSGGNFGKIGQGVKAAMSAQETVAKLYRSVYQPFFSETEIDEILSGSDHYSDADTIQERVSRVVEESREEAMQEIDIGNILSQLGVSEHKANAVAEALNKLDSSETDETQSEETKPKTLFETDDNMEGAIVEVDNPSAKSHGKQGVVVDDQYDEYVKVEIEGKIMKFHTKNLILID